LYNPAGVLDSTQKLTLYDGNGFEEGYSTKYGAELCSFHDDFYGDLAQAEEHEPACLPLLGMNLTSISMAKRSQCSRSATAGTALDRYLKSDVTTDFQILQYWKVQ
jgi:hypothetical protein